MKPYTHTIKVIQRDGFNGFAKQPTKTIKARELKKHWVSESGKFQKDTGYLIDEKWKGTYIGLWLMTLNSEEELDDDN